MREEDTRSVQAPEERRVRLRPLGRWDLFGRIVITLLVIGVGWELVVGPFPDTQAGEVRVMRAQLAALSPYPGSHLDNLKAIDEVLRPAEVSADYTYDGPCQDVQQHYLAEATQAGWSVLKALHVVHALNAPEDDEFWTDFQKTVPSFRLVLTVSCFVHPDNTNPPEAGHIYSVDIADVALNSAS